MGLKCSILGHAYEPAGAERERRERGDEVVTVTQELEECRRCGETRVVSESTEVTAVVDTENADVDPEPAAEDAEGTDEAAGGFESIVERSEAGLDDDDDEAPDPSTEDAEILTEEPDREPGEWPEESVADTDTDAASTPRSEDPATGADTDAADAADDAADEVTEPDRGDDTATPAADRESLSGITVPEGSIVCPECSFRVDAESSFREGDPCPECGEWLTSEPDR